MDAYLPIIAGQVSDSQAIKSPPSIQYASDRMSAQTNVHTNTHGQALKQAQSIRQKKIEFSNAKKLWYPNRTLIPDLCDLGGIRENSQTMGNANGRLRVECICRAKPP